MDKNQELRCVISDLIDQNKIKDTEIHRLTALCQEYRENGDRLLRVADEYKAEIERLKAELSDAEATVDLSGADIERKDAALRVALDALEIQPQVKHIVDAIEQIKEALK